MTNLDNLAGIIIVSIGLALMLDNESSDYSSQVFGLLIAAVGMALPRVGWVRRLLIIVVSVLTGMIAIGFFAVAISEISESKIISGVLILLCIVGFSTTTLSTVLLLLCPAYLIDIGKSPTTKLTIARQPLYRLVSAILLGIAGLTVVVTLIILFSYPLVTWRTFHSTLPLHASVLVWCIVVAIIALWLYTRNRQARNVLLIGTIVSYVICSAYVLFDADVYSLSEVAALILLTGGHYCLAAVALHPRLFYLDPDAVDLRDSEILDEGVW